jgi:hypothetical protein
MRPNTRTLLVVIAILLAVIAYLLATGNKVEVVEAQSIRATSAEPAVAFDAEEKQLIRPTTTTTTLPPTTTTVYIPPTTTTTTPPPAPVTTEAQSSGVNWDRIADCESGERYADGTPIPGYADWHINTGNGYYGGLQFHHDTWIAYGGGQYSNNAHETSRENQIAVASGMGLGHWPNCGKYG